MMAESDSYQALGFVQDAELVCDVFQIQFICPDCINLIWTPGAIDFQIRWKTDFSKAKAVLKMCSFGKIAQERP